jgi:carbon starvation protein
MLFILIACGACSGFHAIVSSGTTSKQLKRETDARLIGYGAMLLEGLVAVISLCFVMMLAADDPLTKKAPNFIYASGMGKFLATIGIPTAVGINFGLLAFTTFVYDTLDICTRLARYIIEELTSWRSRWGRWFATAASTVAPLCFVMNTTRDARGNEIPAWKTFWDLFGASNQLLAALTLLAVTVWLARTRKTKWVWVVLGLPTLFMYVMSTTALVRWVKAGFFGKGGFHITSDPVPWVALVLVALAAMMLVEACRVLPRRTQPPEPYEALAAAALPSSAAQG